MSSASPKLYGPTVADFCQVTLQRTRIYIFAATLTYVCYTRVSLDILLARAHERLHSRICPIETTNSAWTRSTGRSAARFKMTQHLSRHTQKCSEKKHMFSLALRNGVVINTIRFFSPPGAWVRATYTRVNTHALKARYGVCKK